MSTSPMRQQSTPVLVAIHPDGFVEVFGQKNVDAVIVNVPAVGSKQGEILAEEFVEMNIPYRHREIFVPGLVRAAKVGRVVTPAEIKRTRNLIAGLRALDPRLFAGAKEASKW